MASAVFDRRVLRTHQPAGPHGRPCHAAQHCPEAGERTPGERAARRVPARARGARGRRAGRPRQIPLSGGRQPRPAPALACHGSVPGVVAAQPAERPPAHRAATRARGLGSCGRDAHHLARLFAAGGGCGQGAARCVCGATPADRAGAGIWRAGRHGGAGVPHPRDVGSRPCRPLAGGTGDAQLHLQRLALHRAWRCTHRLPHARQAAGSGGVGHRGGHP
ncbi:hypothetical protein D3C71_1445690 [compost metagenome]